jgi:hypothetical protein
MVGEEDGEARKSNKNFIKINLRVLNLCDDPAQKFCLII